MPSRLRTSWSKRQNIHPQILRTRREILDDSRNELLDAYVAALTDRTQASFILLRGVMEGLFSVLFYREQSISLQLWAAGKSFEMLHSMLESDHEFHKFFKHHFESERFKIEYPEVTSASIFREADDLYKVLSSFVHKKSSVVRGRIGSDFPVAVERVFRIFLAFAERIDDLPALGFPKPISFCQYEMARKQSQKPLKATKQNRVQSRTSGTKEESPAGSAFIEESRATEIAASHSADSSISSGNEILPSPAAPHREAPLSAQPEASPSSALESPESISS